MAKPAQRAAAARGAGAAFKQRVASLMHFFGRRSRASGPTAVSEAGESAVPAAPQAPEPDTARPLESLNAALAAQGDGKAGVIHLVDLQKLRKRLGNNWARLAERVTWVARQALARHLGPHDTYAVWEGPTFVVVFAERDPAVTRLRCARVAEEIHAHFLGDEMAEDGGFIVRTAAGNVGRDEPPVFFDPRAVIAEIANSGARDDAAPDEPPWPAAASADAATQMPARHVTTSDAPSATADAPTEPQWETQPWDGGARGGLVTDEKSASGGGMPDWMSFVRDNDRPGEAPAAHGGSGEGGEAWRPIRTGHEDIPPPAFLLRYRPVWHVRHAAVLGYHATAVPIVPAGDGQVRDPAATTHRVARYKLDRALAEQSLAHALRQEAAGDRYVLSLPVAFGTLNDSRLGQQYLPLLSESPESLRRRLVCEVTDVPPGTPASAVAAALGSVRPYVRWIVVRTAPTATDFQVFREAGAHAVGFECDAAQVTDFARTIEGFAERAAGGRLRAYVHGVNRSASVVCAVAAGMDYISGTPVATPTPQPGPAYRFHKQDLYRGLPG